MFSGPSRFDVQWVWHVAGHVWWGATKRVSLFLSHSLTDCRKCCNKPLAIYCLFWLYLKLLSMHTDYMAPSVMLQNHWVAPILCITDLCHRIWDNPIFFTYYNFGLYLKLLTTKVLDIIAHYASNVHYYYKDDATWHLLPNVPSTTYKSTYATVNTPKTPYCQPHARQHSYYYFATHRPHLLVTFNTFGSPLL